MTLLDLTSREWLDLGASVLTIVLVAVLGRWLIGLVLDRLGKALASRTATRLDDLLIDVLRVPLYWFVVVFAAEFSIRRLSFLPESFDDNVAVGFFVLYFVILFVLTWRLVDALFDWSTERMASRAAEPGLARGLAGFFRRLALIALSLIALIVLLSRFGADVTGLVATLGVGSLAVALAAQAAFEDTINGFLIMVDQTFRVGDRIELLDLDTWGDVVDIGLRSSRIRTLDNRMVIVPNSVLGNSLVVNHSFPNTQYRLETRVGVAYGTDLETAREAIVAAVRSVSDVLADHPVEALFVEFGESALNFRVLWWVESYAGTRLVVDRVNTAIYNGLREAGVTIPFPQRDVNHRLADGDVERLARALRGEAGR